MATEIQMGGSDTDRIFLDTDFTRKWGPLADLDTDSTGATAKDMSGWALTWDIRKRDKTATVLLSKTAAVSGVHNSVLASSTQVCTIAVADTDITTAVFGLGGGTFRYSLKRTDAGLETIIAYGDCVIERATQV